MRSIGAYDPHLLQLFVANLTNVYGVKHALRAQPLFFTATYLAVGYAKLTSHQQKSRTGKHLIATCIQSIYRNVLHKG